MENTRIMTQEEWDEKIGEKILKGEVLWQDTQCQTLVARVRVDDKYKSWTYHRDKKIFAEND